MQWTKGVWTKKAKKRRKDQKGGKRGLKATSIEVSREELTLGITRSNPSHAGREVVKEKQGGPPTT